MGEEPTLLVAGVELLDRSRTTKGLKRKPIYGIGFEYCNEGSVLRLTQERNYFERDAVCGKLLSPSLRKKRRLLLVRSMLQGVISMKKANVIQTDVHLNNVLVSTGTSGDEFLYKHCDWDSLALRAGGEPEDFFSKDESRSPESHTEIPFASRSSEVFLLSRGGLDGLLHHVTGTLFNDD